MNRFRISNIALPMVVIASNIAGILVLVILPAVLPATEYARFSLLLTFGQLTSMLCFEWLRQPLLRYGQIGSDDISKSRRALLRLGYTSVAYLIGAGGALCVLLTIGTNLALTLFFVAVYAICQGLFDGVQASHRAAGENKAFSIAWALRMALSLILTVVAAISTKDGGIAFFAFGASFVLSIIPGHLLRARRHSQYEPPSRPASLDMMQIRLMAAFGIYSALASVMTIAITAIIKGFVSNQLGLEPSAGILLAIDFATRIASILGLAVNVIVSQRSYRLAESGSESARTQQARAQFIVPLLLVIPACMGLYLSSPQIGALVVPFDYAAGFLSGMGYACIFAGALALRMFSVDPLIMITRPRLVLLGPTATVILLSSAFLCGAISGWVSETFILSATAVSAVFGLGTALAFLKLRSSAQFIPWAIFFKCVFSIGVMYVVVVILPREQTIFGLFLTVLAGAISFSITMAGLGSARDLRVLVTPAGR